jgi:O-methyltransferase
MPSDSTFTPSARGPTPLPRLNTATGFHNVTLHRAMAGSRLLRRITLGLLTRLELAIMAGHKERETLAAIKHGRQGRESLLSGNEAYTLFSIARAQAGLPGDMAEVGVFEGASAKLISIASSNTPLHLFDTFSGLPQPGTHEKAHLRSGLYAAGLPSVQAFLADRTNIQFHPGLFPASAQDCAERQYSFVHLDVDLESSTAACLAYFYPRLPPGGIILTHDYSYLNGVRAAFTTFLADKPERLIELPSSQALLVKR